jgi:hypothetical protein
MVQGFRFSAMNGIAVCPIALASASVHRRIMSDLRNLLVRAEEQLFIMTQCFKFEEYGYSRSVTWDVMIEIQKFLASQCKGVKHD